MVTWLHMGCGLTGPHPLWVRCLSSKAVLRVRCSRQQGSEQEERLGRFGPTPSGFRVYPKRRSASPIDLNSIVAKLQHYLIAVRCIYSLILSIFLLLLWKYLISTVFCIHLFKNVCHYRTEIDRQKSNIIISYL